MSLNVTLDAVKPLCWSLRKSGGSSRVGLKRGAADPPKIPCAFSPLDDKLKWSEEEGETEKGTKKEKKLAVRHLNDE